MRKRLSCGVFAAAIAAAVLCSAEAAMADPLNAGQTLPGRPRVRAPIDGVASQSVTVEPGSNYVAILNPNAAPVTVTYRVSARAF
jgi:hypothetical protein